MHYIYNELKYIFIIINTLAIKHIYILSFFLMPIIKSHGKTIKL
jgi:hypothetical protein